MSAFTPVLSLRPGVTVEEGERSAVVQGPLEGLTLDGARPPVVAALQTLAGGGARLPALVEDADRAGGVASVLQLLACVDELRLRLLLRYSLVVGGRLLLEVEPMKPETEFRPAPLDPRTPLRLSRFACCRREGAALVVETPVTAVRTRLVAPATAALLAHLVEPASVEDLDGSVDGLAGEPLAAVASFLLAAGVAGEVDGDGLLAEERNDALAQWEFHDLLFHGRTRVGTHDYPLGVRFPFAGAIAPAPALKPTPGRAIPLVEADLDRLRDDDQPLQRPIEHRLLGLETPAGIRAAAEQKDRQVVGRAPSQTFGSLEAQTPCRAEGS